MRNDPGLPLVSLLIAMAVTLHLLMTVPGRDGPLTELQLGEIALAVSLAIFGLQGLISIAVEGRELVPGRRPERLTDLFSLVIVVLSIGLFGIAVFLAYGIVNDWGIDLIGTLAGIGCVVLSLLLVFYKEAFVGDEASFDDRQDGVPW